MGIGVHLRGKRRGGRSRWNKAYIFINAFPFHAPVDPAPAAVHLKDLEHNPHSGTGGVLLQGERQPNHISSMSIPVNPLHRGVRWSL